MRWMHIIEVFILTTAISYLFTPVIRHIAIKTGYLDHPKNTKVHAHPTPLLGGISIYIAFVVGLYAILQFNDDRMILNVLAGATFLLIVGMIDDRIGMMPKVKLLAQFLAAMMVIKSGVRISFLPNYYLNMAVTYLWIIGITNSFNLLDNMNGLSAGIAAIASIFFGIVMWSTNQIEMAVVSFAMAGATIGFLKHNFPKAVIFMGDTGSLVIGFVLASISVIGSWNTRFLATSLIMPVIILAYPIFDTTLVTIIRLLEGRSVFQGGKDHSSHRLALLGLKKKNAVLAIYAVCVILGLAALLIQRVSLRAAVAVMVILFIFMIGFGMRLAAVDTGRFGRKKGTGLD